MSWEERQGSTGSWTDVYDGAALSKAFTGKTAGEWQYRVRGVQRHAVQYPERYP